MTLVLIVTAAIAFLASVLMLHLGIRTMAVRYPIAVLVAYASFIGILRLWLARFRHVLARNAADHADWVDLGFRADDGTDGAADIEFGGGDFGGGGAGGSWQGAPSVSQPLRTAAARPSMIGDTDIDAEPGAGSSGWGFDFDLGDGGLVLVPALAALGAGLASLYVVYAAPWLFAEILVDSLAVAFLYRRIRGVEHHNWLRGVLRRTWLPALLTALVFATAGYLMQRKYPTAPSVGPFWEAATRAPADGAARE